MRLSHHPRRAVGPRRAPQAQRGVTMVEAAIVLPIFLTMVLGFIDVGVGVFQTSQATGAAADGARVGILHHAEADVSGSAAEQAIEDSVRARLVGQDIESIVITCLTEAKSEVGCGSVDPDSGFLRVEVSWPFEPISFVGAAFPDQDIRGSATMAIIRQPTSSSDGT